MIPYILSRVVCYVAGYLYPAYASYKAIKSRNSTRLQAWLMYWTVLGMYTMIEYVLDMVVFWLPFYYDIKVVFILWMMLPQTQGSLYIYQVFVEPYLANHEQEIDRALQDAQKQAKAMGLEYIKRAIAALQKFVVDTVSKAAAGGQQLASVNSIQAATATTREKKDEVQPAAASAPAPSGYFSWAYNIVSPKLAAVATMASQTVARQLPSRPLPQPPISLYSAGSGSGSDSTTPSVSSTASAPANPQASSSSYPWRRQASNASPVDHLDDADSSTNSSLGITTPVSPDDQKRLDQLSSHLETAANFFSRTYMSSTSNNHGASSTGVNPTLTNAANDVRMRTLSLYGEESDQE